jgi:hypothetical protein
VEGHGGAPASAGCYGTKLKCVRKQLIINDEILVEAAGVELYNPLILRKLLVLQEAKSAKNASSPGRRYKNGTNVSGSGPNCKSAPCHTAEIIPVDEVVLQALERGRTH